MLLELLPHWTDPNGRPPLPQETIDEALETASLLVAAGLAWDRAFELAQVLWLAGAPMLALVVDLRAAYADAADAVLERARPSGPPDPFEVIAALINPLVDHSASPDLGDLGVLFAVEWLDRWGYPIENVYALSAALYAFRPSSSLGERTTGLKMLAELLANGDRSVPSAQGLMEPREGSGEVRARRLEPEKSEEPQ